MMHARPIGQTGVIYCLCTPPFFMGDVLDVTHALAAGTQPGMTLASPVIVDARLVRLTDLMHQDLGWYLKRRQRVKPPGGAGPLAMVSGDVGSYGMLRMFAVLADIAGIRCEAQSLVTESMPGALSWMRSRPGLAGVAQADLEDGIARLQRQWLPPGVVSRRTGRV